MRPSSSADGSASGLGERDLIGRRLALWDVAVVAAFIVGVGVSQWAARRASTTALATGSWVHWDSGLYLRISNDGYDLARCTGSFYRPDDWCGTAGWFPGLPYVMRLSGSHDRVMFGLVVLWSAHLITLAELWFGWLRGLPRSRSVPALMFASVFPGMVYYRALFPISLVTASVLGALLLMSHRRFLLAGCCGAVAVVSYPSGILVASAAIVLMLERSHAKERLRNVASFGVPLVLAAAAVVYEFWRTTHRWDAWFLVQSKYHYGSSNPISAYLDRMRPLVHADGVTTRFVPLQSILVAVGMVTLITVVATRWRTLSQLDRLTMTVATAYWLTPLMLGGELSTVRAEALLIPTVGLAGRLWPKPILWLAVPASMFLAVHLGRLFFVDLLV